MGRDVSMFLMTPCMDWVKRSSSSLYMVMTLILRVCLNAADADAPGDTVESGSHEKEAFPKEPEYLPDANRPA
jgi:hypothetical protein